MLQAKNSTGRRWDSIKKDVIDWLCSVQQGSSCYGAICWQRYMLVIKPAVESIPHKLLKYRYALRVPKLILKCILTHSKNLYVNLLDATIHVGWSQPGVTVSCILVF